MYGRVYLNRLIDLKSSSDLTRITLWFTSVACKCDQQNPVFSGLEIPLHAGTKKLLCTQGTTRMSSKICTRPGQTLGKQSVSKFFYFLWSVFYTQIQLAGAQSLDTPIWKLQMWWPKVREILLKAVKGNPLVFPRLSKVEHSLIPGLKFKGVELLQGWLITKDNGKNADGNSRFTWHLRDSKDIEEDRKNLAKELCEALNIRIESLAEKSPSTFEVFDAANLVKLHCGKRVNKEIKYFVDEGEYEVYGVEECKRILTTISELKHVKESGMNFDSRMAYLYMSRIKNAVKAGIWNGKCPEWFIISQNNVNLHTQNATLEEFEEEESNTLDCQFKMVFSNGKVMKVRLHEQRMYQSFYNNEEICHIASKPSCALIDILLAKGGPEAIAESFYSSMRSQQQSGGQSNETLARRTKLQWALPSLQNCKNIIKDGIKTYIQGDDKLRPHRQNTFFSSRNKDYVVSKVIDRIDSDKGRCPFLSDN